MVKVKESEQIREARSELKQWRQWKRTIQLLEETKEEIMDTRKSTTYNSSISLPGGSHYSIHEKMQKIIETVQQYDVVISEYKFLVNRLEKTIQTLLTSEEKAVVLIFTNEEDYMDYGYSKSAYYRLLNNALMKIGAVLVVGKKQEKKA